MTRITNLEGTVENVVIRKHKIFFNMKGDNSGMKYSLPHKENRSLKDGNAVIIINAYCINGDPHVNVKKLQKYDDQGKLKATYEN